MAITVRRESILDGSVYSMELDITQEQLNLFDTNRDLYKVQDMFPNLSAEHREFLISGITPEEWNKMFNEFDDDQFDEERIYE